MKKEKPLVEICRSFSYKLNAGNFESRDFFCSQKREVLEEEAEKISEELAKFCEEEVMRAVYNYKLENTPAPPKLTRQDYAKAQAEAPQRQAEQDVADDLEEEKIREEEKLKVEEIPTINAEEL